MSEPTTPAWQPFRGEPVVSNLTAVRQYLDVAAAEVLRRDAERIERMAHALLATAPKTSESDR